MSIRILITAADSDAGRSCWDAMKAPQHDIFISTHQYDESLAPKSRQLVLPASPDQELCRAHAESILLFCRRNEIRLVLATDPAELLALSEMRSEFAEAGVLLPLPSEETLALCADPARLQSLAGELTDAVKAVNVDKMFDARHARLPALLRPATGFDTRRFCLASTAAEFDAAPKNGSYICQRWPGSREFAVDVFCREGGETVMVVPHSRSTFASGVIERRAIEDSRLCDRVRVICRALRLDGALQFILRAGEVIGSDPELVAVMPHLITSYGVSRACGYNVPMMCFEQALGEEVVGAESELAAIGVCVLSEGAPSALADGKIPVRRSDVA